MSTLPESSNTVDFYRLLFEGLSDAVFVHGIGNDNLPGRFLAVNDAACRTLGYSREELLRMSPRDIDAPESKVDVRIISEKMMRGENALFEQIHVAKNGVCIPVEINLRSFVVDGKRMVLSVARDISSQRKMEHTLRENEFLISNISNNIPNGMIYQVVRPKDGSRKFTFLSEKVKAFYGITPEQGKADPGLIYGRVHEDDRMRVYNEEEQANKTLSIFRTETRMVNPDGKIRWSYFVSCPRKIAPDITCWDGIEFDITDRKKAEEDRAKLQAQLLQAQKMESVGRLAGGVAHDFNNMLGVILGYTELAMLHMDHLDPNLGKIAEIKNAAERSAALTRQLLAFARQQTVKPKVLEINETVSGILKMLRRLIGEDIDLEWLPGQFLEKVKIDPSQVDQILANLCVNARDAMRGGGKITIETSNVMLDSSNLPDHPDAAPGKFVLLSLTDNGIGIEKEILDNIFEPFFTTKGIGKGTGLGLATVYGIVRQNSGFITVSSAPKEGTSFQIYLPAFCGKPHETDDSENSNQPLRGAETILLVEDEPTLLGLGKAMLEILGYNVIAAGNPGSAIRLAEERAGDIQLLMTDVVMPGMNGRELAKKLLSKYPHIKRIFTSGYTPDSIADGGKLDEEVIFLQKPYTMEELASKLRLALDGKKNFEYLSSNHSRR